MRAFLPTIDEINLGVDLSDHSMKQEVGHNDDVRATLDHLWDIAAELDRIAQSLIGDEEQFGLTQRSAIPLGPFGRRHEGRGARDLETPFIFLPALREFAPQQESLGQLEVRPGCAGIERQRASGAGDAFVELEAPIMHDGQIMEGLEIVPVGLERLAADRKASS